MVFFRINKIPGNHLRSEKISVQAIAGAFLAAGDAWEVGGVFGGDVMRPFFFLNSLFLA